MYSQGSLAANVAPFSSFLVHADALPQHQLQQNHGVVSSSSVWQQGVVAAAVACAAAAPRALAPGVPACIGHRRPQRNSGLLDTTNKYVDTLFFCSVKHVYLLYRRDLCVSAWCVGIQTLVTAASVSIIGRCWPYRPMLALSAGVHILGRCWH